MPYEKSSTLQWYSTSTKTLTSPPSHKAPSTSKLFDPIYDIPSKPFSPLLIDTPFSEETDYATSKSAEFIAVVPSEKTCSKNICSTSECDTPDQTLDRGLNPPSIRIRQVDLPPVRAPPMPTSKHQAVYNRVVDCLDALSEAESVLRDFAYAEEIAQMIRICASLRGTLTKLELALPFTFESSATAVSLSVGHQHWYTQHSGGLSSLPWYIDQICGIFVNMCSDPMNAPSRAKDLARLQHFIDAIL